ncbi:LysR family transcriptional regulator [uncultured Mailhella sp.]|uniref:LysR family transcriptional regulator n=1 Tax=uncultured Mailhella sp. TaxID=1981031 RepID=UPI0025DA916E|nr:LysR family transcriptional regulator [uncultured Mailhella sp.]
MNDINVNLIQYLRPFYYVAETRSIRRAAAILCLTPSAVSQQIQKLEEELGMPLFERKAGRPLRLLPAGRFLHSRIPALGNTLFSICCELKNFQEKREVMRLGALALLQSPVLKSIAAHSASLPGLDFSLHFEGAPALCHALLSGELDCAMVFHEHILPTLEEIPLFSSPLVLVAPPSLVRHLEPCPSLEQLFSLPMVYITGTSGLAELDAYAGIPLTGPVRVHVASPVAALEAVRLGLGAAIVCEHALPEDMSGLQRYDLAGMLPPRRVVLALAPQHGFAGKQREFLDLLRKQWA